MTLGAYKRPLLRLLMTAPLLFLGAQNSVAEDPVKIQKASKNYDLVVRIDSCEEESDSFCAGPAKVSIYRKGEDSAFQVLNLEEVLLSRDQAAYNSSIDQKPRRIYDDAFTFIFGDFNFDGEEDLAICTGHNGGYGVPSYAVYLFDKKLSKFIENKALTSLAEGVYLGLFYPDPKKRVLHAYWKSGCCYHVEEIYRVIRNRPVLIEKTEEGPDEAAEHMVITNRKRVNGKWIKKVRRTEIKESPSTLERQAKLPE